MVAFSRGMVGTSGPTLNRRGWRRLHPAVAGLMTGDGQPEVDLRTLAARATRDAAAAEELQRLVDGREPR